MTETLMCEYYLVACIADEDECGLCGKIQYECGEAVSWETFAKVCPNRWETTNECHHGHIGLNISTFQCTLEACPRMKKTRDDFTEI